MVEISADDWWRITGNPNIEDDEVLCHACGHVFDKGLYSGQPCPYCDNQLGE